LIRRLVPAHRLSAVLGWWSAFMPLGAALALLGGPLVIAAAGWAALWQLLAALTVLTALALWAGVPGEGGAVRRTAPPGRSSRLGDTLRSRGPWLVALCFCVYSGQWMSVIGFLPSIYSQAGWPLGWTAVATGVAAAANIIGNVASGRFLQRGVKPDRLLLSGYAAMGLGAWIAFGPVADGLPAAAAAGVRYGAVLMFSAVGGVIPGTLFSLAVRLSPHEDTVSTTVGWMQQWSSLGQFAGPPLVAWVVSRAGGWQGTWWVTGCFALLGIALAFGSRRRLRASRTAAAGASSGP
jgi:CP family cyanate transporter-like MFS transporter